MVTKKEHEPDSVPNVSDTRDGERGEPVAIEAQVVDNAYAEMKIAGRTHKFWPDELHRLRKVLDRVMIELPR